MKTALFLLLATTAATPALAEDFAPVALNSLSAVPAKIAAAPVLDRNGTVLGKVRTVATDQDGKPSALSYVQNSRLAVIAAQAVSYDARKNLVIADTSRAQPGDRVALN